MALALNTPLILRLMDRCTATYWDDEQFRYFSVGPSFSEVQAVLYALDESNYRLAEICKFKVMQSSGRIIQ